MMTAIEKAILKTVAYADVFHYPLTQKEINRFLITSHPVAATEIHQALSSCVKKRLLYQSQAYFTLPGKQTNIAKRITRLPISTQKKQLAQQAAKALSQIKELEAIFLTGALAMDNVTIEDDIDVMLVTRPCQLWTTRIKVIRALNQLGLRRKAGMPQARDLICPNIYVTTQSLQLPLHAHNLYTAHEIAQVKPLYDAGHIYAEFTYHNQWITHYLANFPILRPTTMTPPALQAHLQPGLVERSLYTLQLWYMKPKITLESVSLDRAFFHPRPTSQIVQSQFRKRLNKLGLVGI